MIYSSHSPKIKRIPTRAVALLLVCVLLASVLGMTACESPKKTQSDAVDAIRFTDALGREVSVAPNPSRVAALIGSFADVWVLAGGRLCAAAEDAWEDFGLVQGDAVDLGGAHSPSLERLLSANPDFVLASASTAANVEMRETLEQAGITVAYFDVDHFDDYLQMLKICTDITGRADLYEQNGLRLREQIEACKKQYADRALPEEERTVLLLRASASSLKAKGSNGTVLGEMLRDMGCVNLADRDGSLLENLSIESIIREDPKHIFVVTMGNDPAAAEASLENYMKENPAWGTLSAVREGRLHQMERTLFHGKPNARWAQAYEILYETLTK